MGSSNSLTMISLLHPFMVAVIPKDRPMQLTLANNTLIHRTAARHIASTDRTRPRQRMASRAPRTEGNSKARVMAKTQHMASHNTINIQAHQHRASISTLVHQHKDNSNIQALQHTTLSITQVHHRRASRNMVELHTTSRVSILLSNTRHPSQAARDSHLHFLVVDTQASPVMVNPLAKDMDSLHRRRKVVMAKVEVRTAPTTMVRLQLQVGDDSVFG